MEKNQIKKLEKEVETLSKKLETIKSRQDVLKKQKRKIKINLNAATTELNILSRPWTKLLDEDTDIFSELIVNIENDNDSSGDNNKRPYCNETMKIIFINNTYIKINLTMEYNDSNDDIEITAYGFNERKEIYKSIDVEKFLTTIGLKKSVKMLEKLNKLIQIIVENYAQEDLMTLSIPTEGFKFGLE